MLVFIVFALLIGKDREINGKRKTENGKLLFFDFRLEWENGTLRLNRRQRSLANYAEAEQRRPKVNRRTKQEQRVLAHYVLQEGGKDCKAGLKRKAENFLAFSR